MIAKRVLQMFLTTGMLRVAASTDLYAQDPLGELEPGVVPEAVIRADFSGNSIVGFEDFFQYVGAFGVAGTEAENFDLDSNGRVDFDDLFFSSPTRSVVLSRRTLPPSTSPRPPEPLTR